MTACVDCQLGEWPRPACGLTTHAQRAGRRLHNVLTAIALNSYLACAPSPFPRAVVASTGPAILSLPPVFPWSSLLAPVPSVLVAALPRAPPPLPLSCRPPRLCRALLNRRRSEVLGSPAWSYRENSKQKPTCGLAALRARGRGPRHLQPPPPFFPSLGAGSSGCGLLPQVHGSRDRQCTALHAIC